MQGHVGSRYNRHGASDVRERHRSRPLSEEVVAQGSGVRRCFPLSPRHSRCGPLSEFRGQASAISQDTVHTCPLYTGSTASTGAEETWHSLTQSSAKVPAAE